MRTVSGPTENVVVVGAGLGGLSAALHLAGAGRSVTVVERADVPGGRCGLLARDGFRFDTGPTVLTMPELVEQALNAVGETLADHLTLHRLDPAYRARFADGSTIDVRADPEAMAQEIARQCGPRDADGWRRYLTYLQRLYDVEMPHFIDRNLDSPLQLAGLPAARLLAMGAFGRLAPKLAQFVDDERLQRLFSFQAMYAGLAPTDALAIYAVITYMDCVRGVWFPEGGMHAVPRALAAAASKHGVEFRYGTEVARVDVAHGRAHGVITTTGERIAADVVVVNADLPIAYERLLPGVRTPRRVRKLRYSPSAVVLHAGTSRDWRAGSGEHHVIDFGRAWGSTFDQIIDDGVTMTDPSFLLTTPTATDPTLAPAGSHTHYVLFPAPNTRGRVDWVAERNRYHDHMLETLSRRGYDVGGIETEALVTPHDWQQQGMAAGAPFAAAHTFGQTGPFRSATLDAGVDGLVFAGSNTQPGVGVPMVLVSGRLAAQRITG